ncbi:hypothetical protein [Methylocaldum sp.]|uniref:hypothetical protein n=1 Tax=Methylocaldum sp. TaxID=1969727 RepID=UPI002D314109|nr:hypothetical protein [Methylocaldum sp.]HYE35470.1 hypothetical protein [Methylocaldum sp.]
MTLHIEFWALLTFLAGLLFSFFAAVFAGGKVLLGQVEKRLDERFSAQALAREEGQKHWDTKFAVLETAAANENRKWQQVERELLQLKAELPRTYVQREDWIRFAAVIDAKQDALSEKLNTLNVRLERLIGERER